jgi:hypothetical protein
MLAAPAEPLRDRKLLHPNKANLLTVESPQKFVYPVAASGTELCARGTARCGSVRSVYVHEFFLDLKHQTALMTP